MAAKKETTEEQLEMLEQDYEQQARNDEKNAMQVLKEMEQVALFIPNDPVNKADKMVPVGFNGVIWPVMRGKQVMVPKVIAEIWNDSYERTVAVEERMDKTDNKVLM